MYLKDILRFVYNKNKVVKSLPLDSNTECWIQLHNLKEDQIICIILLDKFFKEYLRDYLF